MILKKLFSDCQIGILIDLIISIHQAIGTDTGKISEKRGKSESIENTGAGNGIRTRDPRLGKTIRVFQIGTDFPPFLYF